MYYQERRGGVSFCVAVIKKGVYCLLGVCLCCIMSVRFRLVWFAQIQGGLWCLGDAIGHGMVY